MAKISTRLLGNDIKFCRIEAIASVTLFTILHSVELCSPPKSPIVI